MFVGSRLRHAVLLAKRSNPCSVCVRTSIGRRLVTNAAGDRCRIDFTDGTLFGNDAGEDELPDVLNSYFVDQAGFKNFLSKENSFQVARSRKGMGKSALLSKLALDLAKDSSAPIIIKATGANLVSIIQPPKDTSFLALQNYWTRVICARINYAIGLQLGFAFTETDMALVEGAEIAGFKQRNIFGALIQRIKSSKIPIEVSISEYNNHEELLKRALQTHSQKNVWVLIDDIDATYVDTPEQQALISTFFSACRALVREVTGLYIRASVRTDVWSAIRKNEDLDKCEQYVSDISWSAPDLKVILSKKVYSYVQRNSIALDGKQELHYRRDSDNILQLAFEPRMKWGGGSVPPFRPIYILSAGRPRWMCQLCRFAGMAADKDGKSLIGKPQINAVLKKYSRFRLNDIYKEHSHQYADLEKLVETFSNCPARYTTGDLLSQLMVNYVNRVGGNNVPELDGFRYTYPMQLAHFLYKIGFIVARKEHEGDSGNADFVKFEERPELLTDHRNPDDQLLWEVHPSYRDALNIGKERRVAAGAQQQLQDRNNNNQHPRRQNYPPNQSRR